jgi:group I intron endonuclease
MDEKSLRLLYNKVILLTKKNYHNGTIESLSELWEFKMESNKIIETVYPDAINFILKKFEIGSCYSTWPETSGIYCVYNKINKKCIVGLTKRQFKKRWSDYKTGLRGNRYKNTILQNNYNKYGENEIIFGILEEIDPINIDALKNRENYWIDFLKSRKEENGFNLRDGGNLNVFSDVIKQNMSIASYKKLNRFYRFKSPSGEIVDAQDLPSFCSLNGDLTPQKMVDVFTGRIKSYKGYTSVDSNFTPKKNRSIKVISPTGEEYTINRFDKFSKEHGLSPSCLAMLASGKHEQHFGWRLKFPIQKEKKQKKKKECELRTPLGEVIRIDDLLDFSKKNELNYRCLCRVSNGNLSSYKGYTHKNSTCETKYQKKTSFISPLGEEFLIIGPIKKFCISNDLNYSLMTEVKNGNRKHHKGWKLKK